MGAVVGGETIETVNARQLHAFLQVGKDFSTWIKARIDKYGFVYGVDFRTTEYSPNLGNNTQGRGRPTIDYHISLDMAKELAMVGRSAKGKEARQSYISISLQKCQLFSVKYHQRNFTLIQKSACERSFLHTEVPIFNGATRKVLTVLGEKHAPKFLGTQKYGNNITRTRRKSSSVKFRGCFLHFERRYSLSYWAKRGAQNFWDTTKIHAPKFLGTAFYTLYPTREIVSAKFSAHTKIKGAWTSKATKVSLLRSSLVSNLNGSDYFVSLLTKPLFRL
ncbi:hypothetical protein GTP27_21090 [Pseudoduganella sp. CY13W]|uniref:AntA/AntB antirepressor domain-containing protein n=2 Tax=Duganella qianjiadongensis TaxID=2692176 RepID=A0ABW9VRF4_9BURK|nr:hypothetical protein [Duganella qianjiadongensis]